ncbi:DUF2974 domain-containing protein [Rhodomicrobium vannielii ATCC 17100]|uniref:DUF2974 domain-containing protein n=1 Tax=Rhodomicrobium vannielii TaxID=1069 RepID=UPI0019188968|nr:DUF2974 domain-containing protein [Rhodomicrobium vannielii]MBJ7532685.1 DUF2974 domain-containing protein [Rhodomicrobium vannielii ATCC 17100]
MTISILPLRELNLIEPAARISEQAPDPRQFEEELARRGAGNASANAPQPNALWKPNAADATPQNLIYDPAAQPQASLLARVADSKAETPSVRGEKNSQPGLDGRDGDHSAEARDNNDQTSKSTGVSSPEASATAPRKKENSLLGTIGSHISENFENAFSTPLGPSPEFMERNVHNAPFPLNILNNTVYGAGGIALDAAARAGQAAYNSAVDGVADVGDTTAALQAAERNGFGSSSQFRRDLKHMPEAFAGWSGLQGGASKALTSAEMRAARLAEAAPTEQLAQTIAAEKSQARTAALRKYFGDDAARLEDLSQFKRADGTPVAKTADERLALASMLAQNPKLTPQEFTRMQDWAQLSNAAYLKSAGNPAAGLRDTIPTNYEHVTDFTKDARLKGLSRTDFEHAASGFRAELFRNKDTGEYVVAFPGSQTGRNWAENIKQGAGRETDQYTHAMNLGKDLKKRLGENFAGSTGHSKGGGQAAAVAMITDKPAITFNAAGLNPETVERAGGPWNESRITNYVVKGEILTSAQEQLNGVLPDAAGQKITLKAFNDQGRLAKPGEIGSVTLHKQDHSLFRSTLVDIHAKAD